MIESHIICDGCRCKIEGDGVYHRYHLTLNYKELFAEGVTATCDVYVRPPLDSPKDFCSLSCLREWLTHPGGPC